MAQNMWIYYNAYTGMLKAAEHSLLALFFSDLSKNKPHVDVCRLLGRSGSFHSHKSHNRSLQYEHPGAQTIQARWA